jgi:hypothetical protein
MANLCPVDFFGLSHGKSKWRRAWFAPSAFIPDQFGHIRRTAEQRATPLPR